MATRGYAAPRDICEIQTARIARARNGVKTEGHYKYLIIGGGMTADAAAKGIREVDSNGSIGIFSLEADKPYDRPPLTKGLWKDKPLDSIWRHTEKAQVTFHLERRIEKIEIGAKRV